MKIDPETGGKRKLSKRKDPELALTFYAQEGYPVPAVLEYLMTLLNSNFEEWRRANPDAPMNDFPFSTKKMSGSGALFDIEKLRRRVQKRYLPHGWRIPYTAISRTGARQTIPRSTHCSTRDPAQTPRRILAIGRGGKKPRKDLALWIGCQGLYGLYV